MAKHELSVQLYTLRNETARDFPGTLRQVAEAGCPAVEFAGFGSHTAAELKKVLDEVGLVTSGLHIGLQLLETQLDKVIEDVQIVGAKDLACPSVPADRRKTADDFRRIGATLSEIGAKCTAAGLRLSYHNHAFEFEQFDGRYALDLLFEAADPQHLQAQFDLGWIAFAGVDPVSFLRKYSGRAPTVHFKDMIKEPERYDVPVGEGILPIPELVSAGREGGTEWFVIELDAPKEPPIETVRRSAAYLKSLGVQ